MINLKIYNKKNSSLLDKIFKRKSFIGTEKEDVLSLSITMQIYFCNYLPPNHSPHWRIETNKNDEDTFSFIVQSFSIFPPSIKTYLEYNTKVQGLVYYKYIKSLYLTNIFENEIEYVKTEIFDACNFSVYYRIKEKFFNNKEFKKDINKYIQIMSKRTWNIEIPKIYVPDPEDIGKCKSCFYFSYYKKMNKKCPYKSKQKGEKKRCPDYMQK